MALKDWKRTRNKKNWITFRRTKDFTGIDITEHRKVWTMQIREANSRPILNKEFKTRANSIKFAKSYMGSN